MVNFPYEFFLKVNISHDRLETSIIKVVLNLQVMLSKLYDIIEFFLKMHHKLVQKWHLGTGVMSVG